MKKDTFEVYYINKYSWMDKSPMVSVSMMFLYAVAKAGVSVTLIAEGDPNTKCDNFLKERFDLTPIPTFRVQLFRRRMFDKIKFTPFFYLQACGHIRRSRQKGKIPVVMTRNTTFLPWLVALKWLLGYVVVFESHSYHGSLTFSEHAEKPVRSALGMSRQFQLIERLYLNFCDGLICQGRLQRDLYVKDYVRIPTAVIPLGTLLHSNQLAKTAPADHPMLKRIALIGSYQQYLDPYLVMDAISICKDDGISFLWIGLQEDHKARLVEEARKRGIEHLCDFRGWMSHSAMMDLLQNDAGAGIIPYRPTLLTSVLVSPTKLFDYFGAKLPVIGPNFPSVSDHIRENVDGVLYEATSAQSLANALRSVFSDEAKYRRMKQAASEAAQRCSWDNRAEIFVSFADKDLKRLNGRS